MPSREQTSNAQFDTVLSVLGALTPYLLLSHREIDDTLPRSLDGGASASAVATFATACNRLDAMLNDPERWKLDQTDAVQGAVQEHFRGAAEVHKAQVQAVADMRRPSVVRKPRLTTIGGEFIAIWGDPSLPGGLILGRGMTPEEALEDFDQAFTRQAGQQLKFAPASEERLRGEPAPEPEQPATPETPEARHKKRKTRKKY